ncbi:MAG: amidohydrolase [Thermoproteota archaeon]
MGLVIKNGIVLTGEKIISEGAVVIEDDTIVDVGDASVVSKYSSYEKIDAKGCIVMPGMINTHTHAAMSILRGYAEDLPLHEWLQNKIWPIEAKLTPKDIELGATLGAYESLLFGVTTLNSMYFYSEEASEAHAFAKVGIRAVVGHGIFETTKDNGFKLTEDLTKTWHGYDKGRIRVSVDPHAPYTVGPNTFKESVNLANELNEKYYEKGKIIIHSHVAESPQEAESIKKNFNINFDGGVVNYLNSIGVLSPNFIAAHVVHVSEEEVSLLAKNNVKISLNLVSNLKLGMGIAPYLKFRELGVISSLGTDSAASNNSLDVLESAKLLALLYRGLARRADAVKSYEVFRLMTIEGAKALCWEDEIGKLEKGYKADIVVLSLKRINANPLYDPYAHLIFSAKSNDVVHVFVGGKQLIQNGVIVGLSYDKLFEEVNKLKDRIISILSS